MHAHILALVALLGLVLAPVLPAQRVYLCAMDAQVHSSCCCHAAAASDESANVSGCCTIIIIHQFLAPGHDAPPLVLPDHLAISWILPDAPLVRVLTWTEPILTRQRVAPPPYVVLRRTCVLLT